MLPWFRLRSQQVPVAIAALYAIFGALWIFFSDALWASLANLPFAKLALIQTVKGLVFVGLSALLLFWLVRGALRRVEESERQRREYESRYRQVFERTSSVCWILDAETLRILDANPAAVRFYGWSREELVGKPLTEINLLPEEEVRRLVRKAHAEQQGVFRVQHRLRSGEIRDVEVHSSPIDLEGRRVLFSIMHDITDRVKAERALVESEASHRRVLEEASDAILISDRDGIVLQANSRAGELFGLPPPSLVGARLDQFLGGEPLLGGLPGRSSGGGPATPVLVERHLPRADGRIVVVELSARELGDGRVQAILRDISERRRLEEQLRQAQKMEAVGQLTGGIAHDLNNLLTIVLANGEMMAGALSPGREDLRHDLEELQAAARRGAQMIRKLLSFSRQGTLSFEVLDLGRVVADLTQTLRRLVPEHIEIRTRVPEEPVRVMADAGAVEQIVLNLVTNARDAMPEGGQLAFEVCPSRLATAPEGAAPGRYVCLRVADTGVGMDETIRARAFEPFFTTKPPGQGTGLGMAMVYGLVRQHGGWVTLDSAPGQGTTVEVYFPQAAEGVPDPDRHRPSEQRRHGTERILLVEDEEGLRRVATRALERLGYRVTTATDGLEALQLLRSGAEVDLVVTDVVMPRLSGPALYRAVREEGRRVRFLFTSGYGGHDFAPGDPAASEVPLLEKPWTLDDLTARVREVLDGAGA